MAFTIKMARLAKGFSKKDMADACRVHENTYADWENHPEKIKVKYAPIIAEKLGVTTTEIIFNDIKST